MNTQPFVSIIINNYNYGHFLQSAINSALGQNYPRFEVIVVDDGSTDDSREWIQVYGDRIVSILKANDGQASAFNAGFAASQGDIVCFLDADDTFLPHKLEIIVEAFQNNDEVGWCFHTLQLIDLNQQQLICTAHTPFLSGLLDLRVQIQQGRLPYLPVATSGLCFRRTTLQQILPMPEAIKITSDNYLKFTACALTQGVFLPSELATQGIHNNNAYTLRTDKHQLKAQILMLTAYWMKTNFPVLSKFTDALLIDGLRAYLLLKTTEFDGLKLVTAYLATSSFNRKTRLGFKILYCYLRRYATPIGV
jgi:glycosyltransferase involved in cell wall biosynthesis